METNNINVTEAAKTQIKQALTNDTDKVFRIAIEGAGCAGFKYVFSLSELEQDDVIVIENEIVTDAISMIYLDGATLDFDDDIFNKTFKIDNPNVKTTCGCNLSFSM